ncbi:head-tail joining protein [Variovorax paradoxus]|uniref:head-tail joining protein n=1 Tax=Variovorax paradoxus TaxID=34073 RepID=UPI0007826C32|nr:hypothetical protein [Variovorax paradoxus]
MSARARFAEIEAMVDAGVLGHLANAIATVAGVDVPVIFDVPSAQSFDGQIDASAPECSGAAELLANVERGDTIVLRGRSYEVVTAEPDGAGFIRLVLGSL